MSGETAERVAVETTVVVRALGTLRIVTPRQFEERTMLQD